MHKDSINKDHWFFFAQTGINITYWLMYDFEKSKIFEEALLPHIEEIIATWDEDKSLVPLIEVDNPDDYIDNLVDDYNDICARYKNC